MNPSCQQPWYMNSSSTKMLQILSKMRGSNSKMLQIPLKRQLLAPKRLHIPPKCCKNYGKWKVPTPKCCKDIRHGSFNGQKSRSNKKTTRKKHNSHNNSGPFQKYQTLDFSHRTLRSWGHIEPVAPRWQAEARRCQRWTSCPQGLKSLLRALWFSLPWWCQP